MFKCAFDRATVRHVDVEGRLHIAKSHISKVAVNPYRGNEIPGYVQLGLDPNKVYRLFRDPVELERSAPTFARLPIMLKHQYINAEDHPSELVVGSIGSDVTFEAPYLDADLCIWEATAIAGIETGKVRELSCSYRYNAVMVAGEFEGQPYDGVMTDIQGNHLALVEVGRAGADVVVADSNPFTFRERAMKMTKLGRALFAVLCAASPILAADSALPKLIGGANRKTFNRADVVAKLIAADADLDPKQLDSIIDSALDIDETPDPMVPQTQAAGDESPADKLRALLAGKVDDETLAAACALLMPVAGDGDMDDNADDKITAAMDSFRKDLREAEDARRDVRPVVGDVLVGNDSAADVYGFALDHMKVERKGVDSVPALRALFKLAATKTGTQVPRVSHDSAGLADKFPSANRFRSV